MVTMSKLWVAEIPGCCGPGAFGSLALITPVTEMLLGAGLAGRSMESLLLVAVDLSSGSFTELRSSGAWPDHKMTEWFGF